MRLTNLRSDFTTLAVIAIGAVMGLLVASGYVITFYLWMRG